MGLAPKVFFCLILSFFVSQVQKPSVCVYRLFVSVCAIGLAWGVALAIWDIMIASGQYYKAMSGGDTVQAFLERVIFFEFYRKHFKYGLNSLLKSVKKFGDN